jgi:hypothetical protein
VAHVSNVEDVLAWQEATQFQAHYKLANECVLTAFKEGYLEGATVE